MYERTTNGIVHAGFSGLRGFVARKKSRSKLIGNCLVIPHDTIPSTVTAKCKDRENDKLKANHCERTEKNIDKIRKQTLK